MGSMMTLRNPNATVCEIGFSKCLIWVQVHGFPILKRFIQNHERSAATIGPLQKIDMVDVDCPFKRNFVRIRVAINVSKPLKQ